MRFHLHRHHRRTRGLVVVALVALASAGLTVSAGAATVAGPSLGSLRVDPATGLADQTNLRLATVSTGSPVGCPATSTRYTVTVTGPGRWAGGVQFTSGSARSGAELDIPMSPTFAAEASSLGAPLEPGRYDIAVECTRLGSAQGGFSGALWFTDSQHYQTTDPATSTTITAVSVDDTPPGRSDLGAPVTLTATVVPTTAQGSVQFLETVNDAPLPYGNPVRVVEGTARITVTDFTFGLHLMSAKFLPTDTKHFTASVSPAPELAHVVAKPIPPEFSSAPTVSGAPRVGGTFTCAATPLRATDVSYGWLVAGQPVSGPAGQTYLVTSADRGKAVSCQVTAANAGGQISATSAPVLVGSG